MSVKLVNAHRVSTIPVTELKDGQLAEIVGQQYLEGVIVQFMKKGYSLKDNLLITVGSKNGDTWSWGPNGGHPSFQVRVLEAGEIIVVEAN